MSILIKGIDMPKNGELTIAFASDENGENTTALILDGKGNPVEHKGVTEIPTPHGRLIDADFLLDTIRYGAEGRAICDKCKSRDCQNCAIKSVYRIIREAPAIIEAEVE